MLVVGRRMTFVSLYDHLHELVPDDVLVGKINKVYAFKISENIFGFFQSAPLAAGKIDLRRVAGHYSLRAKADASQEHLHLFAGGVLGFVQDDESVGERAAAHKGERRDLDDSFFEHLCDSLRIN